MPDLMSVEGGFTVVAYGRPFAHRESTSSSAPIAAGVTLLAVGLMAWDHLWGNQRGSNDSFPVDPATFLVAIVLIVVAGLVVFGVTVPRAKGKPGSISRAAMVHSGIALVLALPASWLGFPAVLAGGGIALGIRGLGADHRRPAIVAIGVGLLVILFAILATAFPAAEAD